MSARPPGVVSGLPNMTPIFSRSWFVKRQIVSVRLSVPASLRSAWLISRRLQADVAVAHLALDLGLRRQGRDRVDRDDVERAGAHEQLGDLERLLAGVGLRDEQVVDVDADLARVLRVHRVLGVDEGADAAAALGLGDHVVDERRLARALRPEDLDDAAARQPADAEGDVEHERPRRDRADLHLGLVAHLHDRALSELSLDLPEGDVESFLAVHLISLLAEMSRAPRTAPRSGADVKGKQPRRTTPSPAPAAPAAAAGARGSGGRSRAAATAAPRAGRRRAASSSSCRRPASVAAAPASSASVSIPTERVSR